MVAFGIGGVAVCCLDLLFAFVFAIHIRKLGKLMAETRGSFHGNDMHIIATCGLAASCCAIFTMALCVVSYICVRIDPDPSGVLLTTYLVSWIVKDLGLTSIRICLTVMKGKLVCARQQGQATEMKTPRQSEAGQLRRSAKESTSK
ncbi:hypothetical protein HDU98_011126 [Podochytrium sp. JEL0797]|nr:hypothetical protein HDU98_011126 [Podochytrium sp. JEL0797]